MMLLPREEQETVVQQLESEYYQLLNDMSVNNNAKIKKLVQEARVLSRPNYFEEDLLGRISIIAGAGQQCVAA